jgi:membrane-bound metal-dependent hydrolase YbcI (DUF457 family)
MYPLAHILFAAFLFKILKFEKKYFLIFLIFSIIPDIDFLIIQHRTITHSIFIPIFFIFLFLIFKNNLFFAISISLLSHILLDIITGKVCIFCPINFWIGTNIFGNYRIYAEIFLPIIFFLLYYEDRRFISFWNFKRSNRRIKK